MPTYIYAHPFGEKDQVHVKIGAPFFDGTLLFYLPFTLDLENDADRMVMYANELGRRLADYRAALQGEIDEIDRALPKLKIEESATP